MAEHLDQAAQREDPSAHLSQPTSDRGSIGAGHDGDQSPRPKRRRITLACNACRDRKVRCDGRRPICSRCAKKRIESECIYEESSLKTQKYLADLLRQAKSANQNDEVGIHQDSTITVDVETQDRRPSSAVPSDDRSNDQPFAPADQSTSLYLSDKIATDALTIVPSPETDVSYVHGGSSTISFVRSMIRAVNTTDPTNGIPTLQFAFGDGAAPKSVSQVGQLTGEVHQNAFALPRRKAADSFVSSFFEFMHPVFPVLHKPSFLATYEKLWTPDGGEDIGNEADDPIFLATVNIVFAIGCHFSELNPSAIRTPLADQFYQQSRSFFTMDILDSPSLSVVQFLLLTGVHLQSTQYASRIWQTIGMAIRAAQELGLHLENRNPGSEGQFSREIRRRVWHTCVILDRLLALTLSRPTMISAQTKVPLPQMVDDEVLLQEGEGSQPSNIESRMGLFIFSIKLFDILHDVLATVYSPYEGSSSYQAAGTRWWSGQRLNDMLRLNTALDELLEIVPDHLKFSNAARTANTTDRGWQVMQANFFQSRFLYIRALLLRPVLLAAVQGRNNDPLPQDILSDARLEQQIIIRICTLCVSTVHELVARLEGNLNVVYRSAGWHTVHYIFACSIVLIAARLCPIPGPDFSDSSFQTSWTRCITVLEHYKPQIRSAAHAIEILQILHQRVGQMRNGVNFPISQAVAPAGSKSQQAHQVVGSHADWPSSGQPVIPHSPPPDELPSFDEIASNSLSDAWFSDQVMNLDWLELRSGFAICSIIRRVSFSVRACPSNIFSLQTWFGRAPRTCQSALLEQQVHSFSLLRQRSMESN